MDQPPEDMKAQLCPYERWLQRATASIKQERKNKIEVNTVVTLRVRASQVRGLIGTVNKRLFINVIKILEPYRDTLLIS